MGMLFLLPIFSAIAQATALATDKVTLSLRRVTFKTYAAISFPLTFFVVLVIFIAAPSPFSMTLLEDTRWWFLIVLISATIGSNIVYYRALDDDTLTEIETFELLKAFPIILLSSLVFIDERNPVVILAALVAAGFVIWSHWEHHQIKIEPRTIPYLFCILVLEPTRALATKMLLIAWHPLSLELVRTGVVAIVLGLVYAKYRQRVSPRVIIMLAITSVLYTAAWLLIYVSYQQLGVVYTTLILTLQPLLIYLASIIFLREKINRKKIIAFGVILIAITIAQLAHN